LQSEFSRAKSFDSLIPSRRALVERAAPLLSVLLGGGDHVRTAAVAAAGSGHRGVRDGCADAAAGSKEVGSKGNRGWGLSCEYTRFADKREREREGGVSELVRKSEAVKKKFYSR